MMKHRHIRKSMIYKLTAPNSKVYIGPTSSTPSWRTRTLLKKRGEKAWLVICRQGLVDKAFRRTERHVVGLELRIRARLGVGENDRAERLARGRVGLVVDAGNPSAEGCDNGGNTSER